MKRMFSLITVAILFFACSREKGITAPDNSMEIRQAGVSVIAEQTYYDKVLGLLIGSAIGDAMGAPTEMWSRREISTGYGFVDDLDSMIRTPSAEGTWLYNLPAGGTTDDTRWKKLFVNFAVDESWPDLLPENFAGYIVETYKADIKNLKATEGFKPGPYEANLMKMAWLQEWAVVGDAYINHDIKGYSNSVSKFYGGEMTCAGMLYSPLIGACAPADPLVAYQTGYDLSIFDIGYARDITALVSAMVSQAFDTTATNTSLGEVIRTVDPNEYFKSRLVGRAAYRFYQSAKAIVAESKELTIADIPPDFRIPREWQPMDSLRYLQLSHAYAMLDNLNEDMPFHAGEIYLITITSMLFSDFDFQHTMEFIVNYGRDNDTVAAVAGAILGAYYGADRLPQTQVNKILQINKELLDTDLEELARDMTTKYLEAQKR